MSEKWEVVVKGGKSVPEGRVSAKDARQAREVLLGSNKYLVDGQKEEKIIEEPGKILKTGKTKPKTVHSEGDSLGLNISKLNNESIKSFHKELLEKFPNQHTVILMDLALHLNIILKVNEESMKSISFENIDFPHALLSNDTKVVLRNVFNGLNNTHLGSFIKSAMIQIVEDNDKGIKSVGLLMLVQVCLKLKPVALISNRKSIFDLLNMHREHPAKFKCFIWVLKQACINFNVACQIWLIYLLPFISQRCHTENVVAFGEAMMCYPTDQSGNDSVLLHTDFLPIVDLVFSQNDETEIILKKTKKKVTTFKLNQIHLQRLSIIYHKIKDQVFTSKTALKDYFASLFVRLSVKNKNEQLNNELLDCLERCLTSCPESVKQLDHLYNSYPQQTTIFLEHFSSKKSAASIAVMKHKSSKNAADSKIHSTAKGGSVSYESKSSCLSTLFKLLVYVALMGLVASFVVKYQYPQHYLEISRWGKPIMDSMVEKGRPYFILCQEKLTVVYVSMEPYVTSGTKQVRQMSLQTWSVSRPYLETVMAKVQETGHYFYEKVNETAPQLMDKVVAVYVSVEKHAINLVTYLTSAQMHEVLESVSKRTQVLAEQVQLSYRSVVTYIIKVVGY